MLVYGYVYKTTDLTNGKIYIGQHKGEFTTNYLGSGVAIKDAIRAKGNENFMVELIGEHDTTKELNLAEINAIERYNSRDREVGYNIALGGDGGLVLAGADNGMYGVNHTESSKSKMSETLAKTGSHVGTNNGFYGKSHTEETKDILRNKCKHPTEFYEQQRKDFTHPFDIEQALNLKQQGLTYVEISETTGVPKTTVYRKLTKYTAHHSNG